VIRRALRSLLAGAVLLTVPIAARAQCTGANHVTWPAVNPVWDFCWTAPSDSSTANGSGLELTDVRYKGTLILARAHVPILNVKYTPNEVGCGGLKENLCYRDWLWQEKEFQCSPSPSPGYCTGATTPPATVCQSCSIPPDGCEDIGSFVGVAVQDKGTSLRLTTQCQAGWYRYIPVWEFFADGTLQAGFEVTSIDSACVAITHHHHAYWRFDVDVNGPTGNFVDELLPGGGSQRVTTERNFIDTSPARTTWQVGTAGSPYVVQISRNPGDEAAGDPPAVPNDFPIADGWVLAYDPNELSDGGQLGSLTCPAGLNSFDNNQNVNGANVVLWVRASALHEGEGGDEAFDCSSMGPTIRVVSAVPVATSLHTVTPCRIVDTRQAAGPYGGPALVAGGTRNFGIAGQCGVPPTARSVAVNLAVTQPTSSGHVAAFPAGGAVPNASSLNFSAGQTRANNAIIPLGSGGAISVNSVLPSGSVHFILDVTGYFE
jgi:hypothetical protein